MGSTSIEEQIVKSAGGQSNNLLTDRDFKNLISRAKRIPMRVTSNYRETGDGRRET